MAWRAAEGRAAARKFWGNSAEATCCLIWLQNGPYEDMSWGDDSPYMWDHGCSCAPPGGHSSTCGAHPVLTLAFDSSRLVTLVTLSHPVDRLTQILLEVEAWPTAGTPNGETKYEFAGYLRKLRPLLYNAKIPRHLIVVPERELSLSDTAYHTAQKLARTEAGTMAQGAAAQLVVLQEVALAVDLFTLFQMRSASKLLRQVAESAAATRLEQAHFSISPLVNGNHMTGLDNWSNRYDPSTSSNAQISEPGVPGFILYEKRPSIVLRLCGRQKGVARQAPSDVNQFEWQSGFLPIERPEQNYDYDDAHECEGGTVADYYGQQMRLMWHSTPQDIFDPVVCEKWLHDQQLWNEEPPEAPVEDTFILAGFHINSCDQVTDMDSVTSDLISVPSKTVSSASGGCQITFSLTVDVEEESRVNEQSEDEDEDEFEDDTTSREAREYRGKCTISNVTVDFKELVRCSIRKSKGYGAAIKAAQRFASRSTPPSPTEALVADALNRALRKGL